MNERILQLALQAKLIASEYNGFDRTTITTAEKRFAELIVRECISNLTTNRNEDDDWSFHKGIYMLREHFGVEE